MTRIQERGRARLKLRLPSWRARFERSSDQAFLDVCEAYELAWMALEHWKNSDTPTSRAIITDYQEIIASLELDARLFATCDGEAP
jgi:hypothetical protein